VPGAKSNRSLNHSALNSQQFPPSSFLIETRSPPGLLAPTLVTLPSMSRVPRAPFLLFTSRVPHARPRSTRLQSEFETLRTLIDRSPTRPPEDAAPCAMLRCLLGLTLQRFTWRQPDICRSVCFILIRMTYQARAQLWRAASLSSASTIQRFNEAL
jgi:hypothetical protein